MIVTATIGGGRQSAFPVSTHPSGSCVATITDISAIDCAIDPVSRTYRESGARMVLDDSAGALREPMLPWYYGGEPVTISVVDDAGVSHPRVYRLGRYSRSGSSWTLELTDHPGFRREFASSVITPQQYPDAPTVSHGQQIPMIYGSLSRTGGALVCRRIGPGLYVVADHPCKVTAAYAPDGTSASFSYEVDTLGRTYCRVGSTTYEYIGCDVEGKTSTTGTVVRSPARVFEDVCLWAGLPIVPSEIASLETTLYGLGYRYDAAIDAPTAVSDMLSSIALCCGGIWYWGMDGAVHLKSTRAIDPTTYVPIRPEEILEWEETIDAEDSVNDISCRYGFDYRDGRYTGAMAYRMDGWVSNIGEVSSSVDLPLVRDEAMAAQLAFRLSAPLFMPTVSCSIPLSRWFSAGLDLGSIVQVPTKRTNLPVVRAVPTDPNLCSEDEGAYMVEGVTLDLDRGEARMKMRNYWRSAQQVLLITRTSGGKIRNANLGSNVQGVIPVGHGTDIGFGCTPDAGYSLTATYIDGVAQSGAAIEYPTLYGVVKYHRIHVVFTPQSSGQWLVTADVAGRTGGRTEINVGGTWTGAGLHASTRVASGASAYIYAYADKDFTLDKVTKNGTDVTSSMVATGTGAWRLSMTSISGDRQIVITFKASPGGGQPETRYTVEAFAYPSYMGRIEIKVGGVSHGAASYDRLSLLAGAAVEISARPAYEFRAAYWTINGTTQDLPPEGGTYSVPSLSGNIRFEARFELWT